MTRVDTPPFRFKQFSVHHGQSPMKVNTDGVLLGAWAPAPAAVLGQAPVRLSPPRALDIGTGCGLIALMLAQRFPNLHIDALDIDQAAVQEAAQNVRLSPWPNRVHVKLGAVQTYQTPEKYDMVVSNPPFFMHDLPAAQARRNLARHAPSSGLSFENLLKAVDALLAPTGFFSLILPYAAGEDFIRMAALYGLEPQQVVHLVSSVRKPPVRSMMAFTRHPLPKETEIRTLRVDASDPDYVRLVGAFYEWA